MGQMAHGQKIFRHSRREDRGSIVQLRADQTRRRIAATSEPRGDSTMTKSCGSASQGSQTVGIAWNRKGFASGKPAGAKKARRKRWSAAGVGRVTTSFIEHPPRCRDYE